MADYFQRLKTDCTVNFDPAIEKAVTVYANNNDLVWLLVAKAGTGKSLMIPFQLALLYGYNVVITQLTRKATTNLYEKTERLIRTYSLPVNAECRFRNSGEQGIIKRSSYPTIIYATDGKITNTSYRKALLGQYGKTVLIIDEIQALNKNQEHCISLGRGRFQENVYGFKILMLSAQIDPEGQRFKDITKFFNNKQIEVIYKPLTTNPPFQCQIQYGTREATVVKSKDEAMETAKSLWNKLMEIRKVDKDSGILIFTACLSEAVLLQDLWLSECQCAPRCSFEKQGSNKCKWANAQRKLISIFFRANATN